MSWPRARLKLIAAAVMIGALTPVLAACGTNGFKPLHANGAFGANVSEKMASVDIAPIPGRVGQRIRNELIYQTTGGGKKAEPVYRLEIAIRESVTSTHVQQTGESRNQVYNLDASFRLVSIRDSQLLLSGQSSGRAGFERFESIFSNVRARRDAENRAATTVGKEMKTRIESFLAGAA